jgi:hypothetical protein
MKLKISSILLILVAMVGCFKADKLDKGVIEGKIIVNKIDVGTIKEHDIEILDTIKVSRMLLGGDLQRNAIYVEESNRDKNTSDIKLIDIDTGNVKKEWTLQGGSVDSPTHVYSISHVQKSGDCFYVVDQIHKFLCFDDAFKRLYTTRFTANPNAGMRSFIDFFQYSDANRTKKDGLYWTRSALTAFKTYFRWSIGIYRLEDDKTPTLMDTIYTVNYKSHLYHLNRKDKERVYSGTLWPNPYGFFKDGKIYYTSPTENRIYCYELDNKTTSALALSHLEPRLFTAEEAERFGYFKTNGYKFVGPKKKKRVYVPYSGPLYHHGMYDIGNGKIGLVGRLDLETMKYRLDVIDLNSLKYLHSIWFPVSYGFKSLHTRSGRGEIKTLFDVDKGVYVWQDIEKEGEELTTMVKITKFKIIEKTKTMNSDSQP